MPYWRKAMSNFLSEEIPVNQNYAEEPDDPDSEFDKASRGSLSSTVYDYRIENGRRYHTYRDGAHPFPHDDLTKNNDEICHHIWLLVFKSQPWIAPVASPKNIVDLGTGIGRWAIDVAERDEDAKVTGIDLTRPEPTTHPNLEFDVDDIERDWTTIVPYDFVHIRSMYLTIKDWPRLYKQCFDNMTSGGYIEQADIITEPHCDDNTMTADSVFHQWHALARQFGIQTGQESYDPAVHRQQMHEAGFVDIVEQHFRIPLGAWSRSQRYKELGKWFELYWMTGAQGWLMHPATRYLAWSVEQCKEFLKETSNQLNERKQHIYFIATVIYGRKP